LRNRHDTVSATCPQANSTTEKYCIVLYGLLEERRRLEVLSWEEDYQGFLDWNAKVSDCNVSFLEMLR
jgi:hypothetical protein